jgi:hypothetical protein
MLLLTDEGSLSIPDAPDMVMSAGCRRLRKGEFASVIVGTRICGTRGLRATGWVGNVQFAAEDFGDLVLMSAMLDAMVGFS